MASLFTTVLLASFNILMGCAPGESKDETVSSPPAASMGRVVAVKTVSSDAPDDLIRALYKTHNDGKSPFFQTKDRALVDRFFVKEMADLIWDDATISDQTGEVAFMEADPLYNAQDTEIKNFTVHSPEIDGEQAEVLVTFTNFGEKQELTYLLEQENGAWRISDLFYGDGSQLFQLLSDREEETP